MQSLLIGIILAAVALCAGGTFAFFATGGAVLLALAVSVGPSARNREATSFALLGLAGALGIGLGLGGFYLMIPSLLEAM